MARIYKVGEKYRVADKTDEREGNIIEIIEVRGLQIFYKVIKRVGAYDTLHWFMIGSMFEKCLKRFKDKCNECIVVYRKDDEVIALDKSTGEKAIAKCHPDDKFDFKTGARVAFMRLVDPCSEEIPFIAKSIVLNTKICITKSGGSLTTGRIYEIKDGKFKNDNGDEFPINEPISDIAALKKYFTVGAHTHFCGSDVEFVEVVE